jgi:hypothetical protein
MYKSFCLCVILFAGRLWVYAQDHMELLADVEWNEGSVSLTDGHTVEGLVRYNPKVGVLSFEDEINGDQTSYTASSVTGFEFFDERLKRQRTYFSLVPDEKQSGINKQTFFEVLLQLERFAVLSRIDPLDVKQKSSPGSMSPNGSFTPGMVSEFIEQDETIFFADDIGNFLPYLRITNRSDRRKVKTEVINAYLLPMYTGTYFDEVQKFSDKEKLSFKKKEDLILILEYYNDLLQR